MEDTVIVIMLKDKETGFLEKELSSYNVSLNENLIYNTYATEKEDGSIEVFMRLTCDRELSDWEYDAVFDYYDDEVLKPYVSSIEENDDFFNPCWDITFEFLDNQHEMEEKIDKLLTLHRDELLSVYEAIADKRNDYIDEETEN
ncbi:MAG: hypothetical protein IAC55_08265 [Tyzzerella sp.]|uniref:Uncharacterized protein n=1 Tax=Candidatus Fimicola merdigallinarum TaxID=2840819 RepID=A0A9D9DWY1_9FIRM|nr:hypothetical protein [Candidatus Fimicola merdigallinarum]